MRVTRVTRPDLAVGRITALLARMAACPPRRCAAWDHHHVEVTNGRVDLAVALSQEVGRLAVEDPGLRVPVAPLFGRVDAEVLCECFEVGGQCAGIDSSPAWVKGDQRIALAALVVPHLHMC
jgi:hypothetical protein